MGTTNRQRQPMQLLQALPLATTPTSTAAGKRSLEPQSLTTTVTALGPVLPSPKRAKVDEDNDSEASIDAEIEKCFVGKLSEGVGLNAALFILGQSNYIVSFSSTCFYISMCAGGHYSLFIVQYYGILRVWFPGTAQIISKKEVWLAFQGNNEGRSGRLKQTRAVTRN